MKAAYIGSIYIENFHAFKGRNEIPIVNEDGTLQQWTVIVGENNAGKTSLLKAVAGLEPALELKNPESNLTYVSPLGYALKNHKYLHVKTSISCKILSSQEKNNSLKLMRLVDVTKELSNESLWGHHFYNEYMGDNVIGHSGGSFVDYNKLENFKIYGYSVSRKTGKNDTSNKENLLGENVLTLFYSDKQLTDFNDWLFQLYFASKNGEPRAEKRIDLIKKLIVSEIFPDISDLRFTTTEEFKNYLEFQTKDGWFQLHELGYGYQTTLAWIFDLSKKMMERYPESEKPLSEPSIVLVDEIDLHLHPSWQRRIINYLTNTFTATQFIVTTHSPHIIQELKEVNLVQLKRENGATKIITRPNSSFQGWTIEEILNELLEVNHTHSSKYLELIEKFNEALDIEDFKTATETYEELSKILHPNSPDRKIMEIQLSQLTA